MTRISYSEWFFVTVLLLFATGLRFVGITFGQPNPEHFPSYVPKQLVHQNSYFHPDEFLYVMSPLRMVLTQQLNPQFLENPSFLINVNFFTYLLTDAGRGMTHEERAHLNGRSYAPFPLYVIGRTYSALGGVITVAASYAVARRMAGQCAGAVSGMLVAVSLPLVQHAHYTTTSSLATGFVMVAIWASFSSLQARRWRPLMFMLSGIASGFAAGNRYNAAAVSIVVFVVGLVVLYRFRTLIAVRRVLIGWLLFPAAFVLSTPHVIFDSSAFVRDFRYISSQYAFGDGITFTVSPWLGLWLEYRYLIVFGLGVPAACFILVAIVPAWKSFSSRRKFLAENSIMLYLLILLIYITPYSFVILRTPRPDLADQMLLPVLPVFALVVGVGASWLYNALRIPRYILSPMLVLIVIAVPLVSSLQLIRQLSQPDTRQLMEDWVYEHLPMGSVIHLDGAYNLALDETNYHWTQNLVGTLKSLRELRREKVDYVVMSDAWYHAVQRGWEVYPADYRSEIDTYLKSYTDVPVIAYIARPTWTGFDWLGHSSSYWHNPGLTVYCLNQEACQAVR